jgi:hypothetical protein
MVSIGIDLGTSNTVVAKVNDEGEVSIHQFEGGDLLPSIIHVEGEAGYRIVGRSARDLWADPDADPSETFRRWKMSMAAGTVLATQDWGDGPKNITPEQLTTWLVEHIMKSITQDLGGETVDSVVVTVPHGWRREHVEKCLATREAARAAQADGRSREAKRGDCPLGTKVADRTVDEPVAAAAYALHASGDSAAFVGKNMLIVDIGGGTTDLSLVRVGAPGEPLTVIDAVNNNIGGDYATALLLGKHLENIGSQIGIDVPLTPEAVLADLEGAEKGWLREAFAEAETELLHKLSARFKAIEGLEDFTERLSGRWGRRPITMSSTVGDSDDLVATDMSCSEYLTRLEPFFESTRKLLTRFLSRGEGSDRLPYAILMTGGGSQIGSLRSRVIEPVIRELAGPTEAPEILGRLDRLRFNDSKLSTAVAMGAALVAAGRISIEERLLWDVGLEIRVTEKMSQYLGLDDSCCVISPLLTKGTSLPATVSLKEFGFGKLDIESDDQFIQRVVVFDDLRSPYDRTWERELSGSGDALKDVGVTLTADTEGMLRLVITGNAGGELVDIQGQLHRPHRAQTGGLGIRDDAHPPLKTRTPQQIIEAKSASDGRNGSSAVRIRTSTTQPGT